MENREKRLRPGQEWQGKKGDGGFKQVVVVEPGLSTWVAINW